MYEYNSNQYDTFEMFKSHNENVQRKVWFCRHGKSIFQFGFDWICGFSAKFIYVIKEKNTGKYRKKMT